MTPDPVEYGRLRERDALVARARVARERLELATEEDLDELLHDLCVRAWPMKAAQDS